MAGPVILDESKVQLASERAAGSVFNANNIHIHLYYGAGTPDHTDTEASLAANEATFTGYSPQSVTSWGSPVLDAGFKAVFVGSPVTFTNSGGSASSPIYGWWYEDSSRTKAVLFGKFTSPITIPAGTPFTFTPTWTDTGENITS
jgi:hypothetical protein